MRKKRRITLPGIINSEVNLLVFPFFALHSKGLKEKSKTEYKAIAERQGQKIEISWKVTADPEYGYPGPCDREVHKAIEQIITEILKKKGKVTNPIRLGSLYSLCKRMGVKIGGSEYEEIKSALERIRATNIKSEGVFYNKKEKTWIHDVFGLYERVILKGKRMANGEIADNNYLFLGSWYLENLNSFYVKPINYNYLKTLKSNIASRLYEILGVKFYGLGSRDHDFIRYRYSTLCQLLPVTPQKYLSLVKRQLDPAHEELRETKFLSRYIWDENSHRDCLIYYWSGERAKDEMKGLRKELTDPQRTLPEPKETSPLPKSGIELVGELVALGVSKITARTLVKRSSEKAVKDWIKGIHYSKADDKPAYLVKAIKENWQVPEGYLKAEGKEKQRKKQEKIRLAKEEKEKEERTKRLKEKQRLDAIYDSLDPLQQREVKEEIENRLSAFWRGRLTKEPRKGNVSRLTKAALENKKREVIKDWVTSGKIKSENNKV